MTRWSSSGLHSADQTSKIQENGALSACVQFYKKHYIMVKETKLGLVEDFQLI